MSDDTIKLLSSQPQNGKYALRLYITDNSPRSVAAWHNLKELCEAHLPGRYQIEVIDLLKNPERAQEDQILAVPTLVKNLPRPIQKFIGNLSNPQRVLVDFDLLPLPLRLPASEKPKKIHYALRLYVAGSSSKSSRAITNIKAICEIYLKTRYALTVVDLYEQRERARNDQIMVAPTLIRQSPLPVRRVIGDLSNTERVLVALDLPLVPIHA